MTAVYYTYLYIDPVDNIPVYVGYGQNFRAFEHFSLKTELGELLRQRILQGHCMAPIINVEENIKTAKDMEKFWIKIFGRKDRGDGTLFNKTDGCPFAESGSANPFFGKHHSEETKKRISATKLAARK
jgi:hypothetical protein